MNLKNYILSLFIISLLFAGCSNKIEDSKYWQGLIGAYYGDPDLTNIKFSEVLYSLDNEWDGQTGHGSSWSAQYDGYIISPISGELTIILQSNKNTILEFIDKKKIETHSSQQTDSYTFQAEEGEKYPVNLKFYYTKGDPGIFKISWMWDKHDEEVIPHGAFVFDSDQSIKWNWIPEPDPGQINFSEFTYPKDITHKIVFYEEGKFAGWPANGGIWSWGDEIVVNFTVGFYKKMENHHSIDETKPVQSLLARSTNGGETWQVEGEFKITTHKSDKIPPVDFSNENLAVKCNRDNFIISYDRGKTWEGYYPFPDFGFEKLTNRTDYIPLSKNACMFFLSYEDKTVQSRMEDKAFAAITKDGGNSFTKLGLICPDDNYRAVMPSSVQISTDHFITALRRRFDERFGDEKPQLSHNWIDVYETFDGGKSWQFLSKVADTDMGKNNGNPPSMIKLNDGRLCVTYGYRAEPYGIRAKISNDNGKIWSGEIHLRDHAREYDFGYTRSVQRTDGRIVTIYYFCTDDVEEQHIAATIWDPNSLGI